MNQRFIKPLLIVLSLILTGFIIYRAFFIPESPDDRSIPRPDANNVDTIINRGDGFIQPIEVVWDHVIRDISNNPIHKATVTLYKNDRDSTGIGVSDSLGKLRIDPTMIALNGDLSKNQLKQYISNSRRFSHLLFFACLDSFSGVRRDTSLLKDIVSEVTNRTEVAIFVKDKTGASFNNFAYSLIKNGVSTKGTTATGKAVISSYTFDNDITVKIKRQPNDLNDLASFTIRKGEFKNIGVNRVVVYLK